MAWDKIGSLRKSDKGNFYIKVDKEVTLASGQSLQVRDPRKSLAEAVEKGRMTKDKADEMLANMPEWLKYEIWVTPDKV